MRKVWVVVANSSESKIYRAENVSTLVEHKNFSHNEGHMQSQDLASDGQGRATQRGSYGTDTMEQKTSPKQKEALLFAEQISKFLHEGLKAREVERLYIISKAPFLGFLRQALSNGVAQLIEGEVHKDLTQAKASEIREYLPPVL